MDVAVLVTPLYPKHTPISLIEAQSQGVCESFTQACSSHCEYHPLVVCSCGACENKAC